MLIGTAASLDFYALRLTTRTGLTVGRSETSAPKVEARSTSPSGISAYTTPKPDVTPTWNFQMHDEPKSCGISSLLSNDEPDPFGLSELLRPYKQCFIELISDKVSKTGKSEEET